MTFSTPKLEAAVAQFKALCPGHSGMFRFGNFYVRRRTTNDLFAQIKAELKSNRGSWPYLLRSGNVRSISSEPSSAGASRISVVTE